MPCEHWFGRLGIHDDRVPPPLTWCKDWRSLWSWLPVLAGILLMAENLRHFLRTCPAQCRVLRGRARLFRERGPVLLLAAFGSSIFPIFYNHWVLLMYVNDAWYPLLPVQLLFSVTDDVALLLRFCNAMPEIRVAIHSCHLLFLFTIESEPLKYIGFIIDDSVELAYAFFYVPPSSPYRNLPMDVPPEVLGKTTDEELSDDSKKNSERGKKDGALPRRMRCRILLCTYAILAALAWLVGATAVRLT